MDGEDGVEGGCTITPWGVEMYHLRFPQRGRGLPHGWKYDVNGEVGVEGRCMVSPPGG